MAKRLSVKAELLLPDFKKCKLTVTQSDYGMNFGHNGREYHANNVTFYSYGDFAIKISGRYKLVAYMPATKDRVHTTIIPAKDWKKIKEAVRQYNDFFSDENMALRRIEEQAKLEQRRAAAMAKKASGISRSYSTQSLDTAAIQYARVDLAQWVNPVVVYDF